MRQFSCALILCLVALAPRPALSQAVMGAISGLVSDASGGSIGGAVVSVHNVDTNLELKAVTRGNGSYELLNIPAGNYTVAFSKEGFKTESHTSILVQGDRTTTVNGKLEVGSVATSVEVTATPLLNQTDTTTGYVLDTDAFEDAFRRFKDLADKKKHVFDEDIAALVDDEIMRGHDAIAVKQLRVESGTGIEPVAALTLTPELSIPE